MERNGPKPPGGCLTVEPLLSSFAAGALAEAAEKQVHDHLATCAACVAAGATEVTVHPYFLAPGRHSTSDIPRMVAEAAKNHPGVRVRVTAPLGLHEKICQVVLERVREMEAADAPTVGR